MQEKTIGEKIREYRQKKGLTQDALAAELHISSQSISKWENGQTMPDINMLLPLSKELGIGLNDLLGGDLRQTFEKRFQNAVRLGEQMALIVSEEALQEFPDDETFLYRRACDEYFLGTDENIPQSQRELYLGCASYHFGQLHHKYPDDDNYTQFLAEVRHAEGSNKIALDLLYSCKKSEVRDRLIAKVRGGDDEIRYKQEKIQKQVRELYDMLIKYDTRDSVDAARALIEIMWGEEKDKHNTFTWFLNVRDARLCLSEGNIEGYLARLEDAYEAAKAYDSMPNEPYRFRSPLYDRLEDSRASWVPKEIECFISSFFDDRLCHPSSRDLIRKTLTETVKIDSQRSRNWMIYYNFCRLSVNKNAYFNYSLDWDLTDEERDAIGAVYAEYYAKNRSLAAAYMLEAYCKQVERLVGGGVMTGYMAYLESVGSDLGYCNCGPKEKYRGMPKKFKVSDLPEDAKVFSIVELLIARNYRLCGLDDMLIDRAVREAKVAGYTHVEAYPLERLVGWEVFDHLVAYYKKSGFDVVYDLSDEDDARCYLMRKKL